MNISRKFFAMTKKSLLFNSLWFSIQIQSKYVELTSIFLSDKNERSFHVFIEGNDQSEKSTKFLMRGAPTVYFLYQVFLAFLSLFICYRADGYIDPARLSLYNPFKFVYFFIFTSKQKAMFSFAILLIICVPWSVRNRKSCIFYHRAGSLGIRKRCLVASHRDCTRCCSANRMSFWTALLARTLCPSFTITTHFISITMLSVDRSTKYPKWKRVRR